MLITIVSNLTLLTGESFGQFSSSWSTASTSSLISMLRVSSQLVCVVFICLLHGWFWSLTLFRHQYPYICVPILWLQDYHAYQNLETYRNGLCHCQSWSDDDRHEFSIDDLPFFFYRASLLWKKPNYHWSHQRTSGSVLQLSFSKQVLCVML